MQLQKISISKHCYTIIDFINQKRNTCYFAYPGKEYCQLCALKENFATVYLQGIRYAETEGDTCYCEDDLNSSSSLSDVFCGGTGNEEGGDRFRFFYDTTLDAGL